MVPPRHLYIHVPFCARRCSYCDFSIAVRRHVPVAEYLGALRRELASLSPEGGRYELDTVYLGGGTPSRLGAGGITSLLSLVRAHFDLSAGAEVTIEANPDDVVDSVPAAWRAAGVNRVSLGLQSFDDTVLQWMHRVHDSAQATRAFEALRDACFDNISVDLIFALPESLGRSWQTDLEKTLALEPDHVSLYGLTIEPGTPLSRWHDRGAVVAAAEDRYAEDFLLADRMSAAGGYEHYEVSNFAKPNKSSRHNSAYWSGASYLGIGPSAHSYDGESRSWNVSAYTAWVDRLSGGQSAVEGCEHLTESNRDAERVYLGLRTSRGLPVSGGELEMGRSWSQTGWAIMRQGDVVQLTPEGWLRLDSLAAALTALSNR